MKLRSRQGAKSAIRVDHRYPIFRNAFLCGLLIVVVCSFMLLAGQRAVLFQLDQPVQNEEKVGHLAEVLAVIATTYRLPMIIELAKPLPSGVRIPPGQATARRLLDAIVASNPDYAWEAHGAVVHIYHKSLKQQPKNFLNWKIEEITFPDNVADLKLRLGSEVGKIRSGVRGQGGLLVGLRSSELSQHKLPRKVLRDVTVRDVLFAAAELDKGFYSLVAFPTSIPQTEKDLDEALLAWRWLSFSTAKPQ